MGFKQKELDNKKKDRKKPLRSGRINTEEKIAKAKRHEDVYPVGVDPSTCSLSHIRPIIRIEDGQALWVAYRIYRAPTGRYGVVPGALDRSEFGLEIILAMAHQVYALGLSFDKVIALQKFFQNLDLKKSQVDAMLHQLSRVWEKEFESLLKLLTNSIVVHADETSWSIKSVWAFLSENSRVVLFGVNKDAKTLAKVLDPASYNPKNKEYTNFADGAFQIFCGLCAFSSLAGRLSVQWIATVEIISNLKSQISNLKSQPTPAPCPDT